MAYLKYVNRRSWYVKCHKCKKPITYACDGPVADVFGLDTKPEVQEFVLTCYGCMVRHQAYQPKEWLPWTGDWSEDGQGERP